MDSGDLVREGRGECNSEAASRHQSAAPVAALAQVKELSANVEEPLVLAIAANKSDLAERAVPVEAAQAYAASIGAVLFETSAKEDVGVKELFTEARWLEPSSSP